MITARDLRRSRSVPRGDRPLHEDFRAAIRRRCRLVSNWTGVSESVLDRMADGEPVKMSSTMLTRLGWLALNIGYEGDYLEPLA